jgi:hypothetical protein
MVRLEQVTDGKSRTLMLGEKFLHTDAYLTGDGDGDNQNPFCGIDADLVRSTHSDYWPPTADRPKEEPSAANQPTADLSRRFGSAHPMGLHVAYVDGSVHFMKYEIDKDVYVAIGSRNGDETADVAAP